MRILTPRAAGGRSLAVGMMHGLAGSAALVALAAIHGP